MYTYELYLNKDTNVFELHDDHCRRSQKPEKKPNLVLFDTYESNENIHKVLQHYLMKYPQRHIVLADCCKDH